MSKFFVILETAFVVYLFKQLLLYQIYGITLLGQVMDLIRIIPDNLTHFHGNNNIIVFLPLLPIHYHQQLIASLCYIGYPLAVRAEDGISNAIVFLPFISIYYHQLLIAPLSWIGYPLAVRAEDGSACHNTIVFLPFISIYYHQLLIVPPS
jgi:hypothetical protein